MSRSQFLRRFAVGLSASVALFGALSAQAEQTLRIGFRSPPPCSPWSRPRATWSANWASRASRSPGMNSPVVCRCSNPLNVGNVDLSADVADTVPVFAQAAGAQLTYFARETPSPTAQSILVPHDSPLKSLADLKASALP